MSIDEKALDAGIIAVKDALLKGIKQQVILLSSLREAFTNAYEATKEPPATDQPVGLSVDRGLLLTAIYADIEAETLGNGHPVPTITIENLAQSIMGTIAPFLASTKRESVAVDHDELVLVLSTITGQWKTVLDIFEKRGWEVTNEIEVRL